MSIGDEETLAMTGSDATEGGSAPPAQNPEPLFEPGDRVGRYVVLSRIGAGAMGVVYRAHDPELDRPVAVKLLRRRRLGAPDADRLLREGRAMARLSHPNVVTVHDVGTARGSVFIAMELVEGATLRAWLDAEERSLDEIVAVFTEAARGLAAAHDAGLVHRDFKPDNVLVGADGRVRVVDFGLVCAAGEPAVGDREPVSDLAATHALTETGAIVGTPAYMAPEQYEGVAGDARSDQFAFCIALYEAVHGERPFRGDSLAELASAARRPLAPRPDDQVPRWLADVLARGLTPKPEDRFASMDDLARALAPPRRSRGVTWLAATAGVLIGGVAVAFAIAGGDDRPAPCRGAGAHVAPAWNDDARARVRASFAATGAPYAARAADRAVTALDDYGAAWEAMHTDACEATHVRGEQSRELLDLRMACLDDRLQDFRATAGLLADADAVVVRNASRVIARLAPLDGCADADALLARVPPPEDPGVRSRWDELRGAIAGARASHLGGKNDEALAKLESLRSPVETLDYRRAEAELLFLLGQVENALGQYEEAEQTFHSALAAAEAGRDDHLAARIATNLADSLGDRQYEIDEALRWAELARAKLERLGPGYGGLRATLHDAVASTLYRDGQLEEALAAHERALAIRTELYGEGSATTASTLNNMANVLYDLDRTDEALERYREAERVWRRHEGDRHPRIALVLTNYGPILRTRGQHDEAIAAMEEALSIREEAFGRDHPDTAMTLNNLANVYLDEGDYDRAHELHGRALARRKAHFGEIHPHVAMSLFNRGDAMWAAGKCDRAIDDLRRGADVWAASLREDHPHVAYPLTKLGDCLRRLGRSGEAIPILERALAIRLAGGVAAELRGQTRFALARALAARGTRRRALELARAARADYAAVATANEELAEVDAWLANTTGTSGASR